jgi:hypothetical protein
MTISCCNSKLLFGQKDSGFKSSLPVQLEAEVEAVEMLIKERRGRVQHLNCELIDEIGVKFSNLRNNSKATCLKELSENPRYPKEAKFLSADLHKCLGNSLELLH